jgi:lysozyme family protein
MSFERDVAFVLAREGAYVNDPKDPGGETNFGIARRFHPTIDIKNLTREKAIELYREEYWKPIAGEQLLEPLGLIALDTAVNCGVARARQWLQLHKDPDAYLWARLDFYRAIPARRPASLAFLPGWLRRMVLLHDASQEPR